jgi:hypothetical protein
MLGKEDDITEKELESTEDTLVSDPLDLMTKAIKVHSENIDLNEDATLSNLDSQLSRYAKYVMEQVAIVGILATFFRTDCKIVRYSNKLDNWGKEVEYLNPENNHFRKSKQILMNKVHSVLLLSRSVKGRPLRAFLEYGKPTGTNPEKEKLGLIDRVMGRKDKKEEEEYG